jgi:hypothetical protein
VVGHRGGGANRTYGTDGTYVTEKAQRLITFHLSLLTSHRGEQALASLSLPVTFELDVKRYLLFLDTGAQFLSAKLVV